MPTLEWIGKDKVVNHHQEVPFRVLERQYSFDENGQHAEDNGSENMIIHGDNLEALKALLPRYEGKVKCIYIDPPYNTGNEGWVYNDNVNDPKIKKWLGEVVGKEGEDLSRHDKWLCMMYPRLRLLQKLLHPNGCMAISIGYHELPYLMQICKELFSSKQIQTITVQTSGGKPSGGFNIAQEYILFITPNDFSPNPSEDAMNKYSSPYHGMNLATFGQVERPNQTYPIFVNTNGAISGVGKSLQELIDEGTYTGNPADFTFNYDIAPQGTVAIWPVTKKGDSCVWRLIPTRVKSDWQKGYIKVVPQNNKNNKNKYTIQYLAEGIIKKIENGELKTYRSSEKKEIPTLEIEQFKTGGVGIPTIWTNKKYYTTRGSNQVSDIFGVKNKFSYPKPLALISEIISRVSDKDSIVLDSFSGSGTTAHALLNLNRNDGGNRKFILIEMGDYVEEVTSERIKRVINGYHVAEEKILFDEEITVKNLSNGAEIIEAAKTIVESAKKQNLFEEISPPRMEDGHLCVIAKTKSKILVDGTGGNFSFYELGEPLLLDAEHLNEKVGTEKIREYIWFMETKQPYTKAENGNPYYLGQYNHTAYYFFYQPDAITTLDYTFLSTIPEKPDGTVIYADRCALSDAELVKLGITFKKIPRDIAKL